MAEGAGFGLGRSGLWGRSVLRVCRRIYGLGGRRGRGGRTGAGEWLGGWLRGPGIFRQDLLP